MLFDGITRNALNSALVRIYSDLSKKYKPKCQHCCRHTFSTRFVGMTCGDFFLAKAILGHKDLETTMRYVHIFEAINRKVRAKEQKKSGIELI
ncbi:MAG: tyrosine-type recombinase/integrase [Bdellovibrionales bacterium]|nr:tyrosine-type recombinase/integrase [Bdellovibrionales bacterium]